MLARLTPAPGRGAVLAAGAVVLTTFAVLFDVRVARDWSAGGRTLLYVALALLVGVLAHRAPLAQDTPLPYHATLQVAAIVLAGMALLNLADLLGASGQFGGNGQAVWTGTVLALLALSWARATNSAIMTLLAALLGVLVVQAFASWVGSPGVQTVRWLLLACAIGLTLGAVWLRDRARRHAVALADVAGISIAILAATLLVASVARAFFSFAGGTGFGSGPPHSVGWKLVILAFGFGLVAYGAVDRERVPPFLGVILLAMFVAASGIGFTSFVGWPLVLLIIAVALLAIGLRPRQELPPEPPVHQ